MRFQCGVNMSLKANSCLFLLLFSKCLVRIAECRPQISLEYKPMRPFYHPNPGNNVGQIIPPGQPWPDSPAGYANFSQSIQNKPNLENRIEATTSTIVLTSPSLEFQPARPSFHPNPGNNIAQIVKPGQPWPESQAGYNITQSIQGFKPNLENRVEATTSTIVQTSPSLEFQPARPSFHPNPGNNIAQIVKPGQPWPDSQAGYNITQSIQGIKPNLENRVEATTSTIVQSSPSLEYQPSRPSFHPNPGNNVAQIVKPGQPWPDSQPGHNITQSIQSIKPNLENRIEVTTSTIVQSSPSLEYKPTRPFYHPNPGNNVGQIIPPGKPWPASQEEYQNFKPNLENRFKETTQSPGFIWPDEVDQFTTKRSTATTSKLYTSAVFPNLGNRFKETTSTKPTKTTTVISLEYKPMKPFYYPSGGVQVGQIIPPGKPWPDSAAGYQNFSASVPKPSLVNRFQETSRPSTTSPGFVWPEVRTKEEEEGSITEESTTGTTESTTR